MLHQALFEIKGPVAVRFPRGGEGAFTEDTSAAAAVSLRSGGHATLVGYGVQVNHLLLAAEQLAGEGIETEVVKLNRISPLDTEEICSTLGGRENLLVLEDSFGAGCVGQRLAAILTQKGLAPRRLILKNLGKTFAPQGSVSQLEHSFGLDAEGVAAAIREVTEHGK